jgi:hypothetical protein
MKPSAYAVQLAHALATGPTDLWPQIRARLGYEGEREILHIMRNNRIVDLGSVRGDHRWALELIACQSALESWGASGYPIAVESFVLAGELGSTEPPGALLSSPHGTDEWSTLLLLIDGVHSVLVTNWRTAQSIEIINPANPPSAPLPVDARELKRLIANVGFAVLKRTISLRVREIRPEPALMARRGRKHYQRAANFIRRPSEEEEEAEVEAKGIPAPCLRRRGWILSVSTPVRGHLRLRGTGARHSFRNAIWLGTSWEGPEDAPAIHTPRVRGPQ